MAVKSNNVSKVVKKERQLQKEYIQLLQGKKEEFDAQLSYSELIEHLINASKSKLPTYIKQSISVYPVGNAYFTDAKLGLWKHRLPVGVFESNVTISGNGFIISEY